ncbi:MAG: zinc ribbon domain-containing protein [Cyclobacteriaceae bacterium]|nr:zinc ribbon domain-containing protein [Cyclobacteriaceae bacterium]
MNCPNCQSEYPETTITCTKCGFPFTGNDQEKSSFIAKQILKAGDIGDATQSIKNAQNILYGIGIVTCLFSFFVSADSLTLILNLILGVGFLIFGYLVIKSPMQILTLALALLLSIYLLNALIDWTTLFRGIIWKVICVSALSYAIIKYKKAEKIKKESDYLSNIK